MKPSRRYCMTRSRVLTSAARASVLCGTRLTSDRFSADHTPSIGFVALTSCTQADRRKFPIRTARMSPQECMLIHSGHSMCHSLTAMVMLPASGISDRAL